VLTSECGELKGLIPFRQRHKTLMKHLLAATGVFLFPAAIHAQEPQIHCPGENTVEMRYCAGVSWEQSTNLLKRKIPRALFQQWQEATRAVCAHAYALYKNGTIYPQLVVGCDDTLNRALLKEFAPINNQGDPERTP
jgi:hypothetical protein